MINRVAFDIGNVICRVDMEEFFRFLVDDVKLFFHKDNAERFMEIIQSSQDLGLYGIKDCFFIHMPRITEDKLDKIYNKWIDIHTISPVMIDFLDSLDRDFWDIALLSNIGLDYAKIFEKITNENFIKHFSCYVGARKPSKLFYQSFSLEYKWDDNVLFFDDRKENIEASYDYFNGVLFNINHFENDQEAVNLIKERLEYNGYKVCI